MAGGAEGRRPPAADLPSGEVPEQIHLGPAVADLDAAVSEAQEPGAELVPLQPVPDRFRVLLDPPGHPFCHSTQIPEAAR